ncbi:phage tail protein [Streptomyces sp. ms191]|uniref:phage tail protein n=1 Tax=unclassified Streptomyces TaxID=2593676 RepID=UPI0011CDB43F|nr:phage tail protein [Streptomyces sp. ms191]TXS33229.1 phage tail protein [Streptomyces sp. ms191]
MSLTSSIKKASDSLRNLKTQASGAATSVKKVGDAGNSASGQLKNLKSNAQGSSTQLKSLKTASDQAEKSMTKAGQTGQTAGGKLGRFESGAGKAAKGQDKLNKSMKGNFLARLLELFMPLIEKIVEMAMRSKTMQTVMKKAFSAIKTVISSVMKAIGPIMKKAGDLIKTVWNGIKKAVTTVVKAVATVIKTYVKIWKTVITTVMNAIKTVVRTAWNGIKAVITPVVNWIKTTIPNAFRAVKDKMSSIWNGLKDIASRAFNGIKSGVSGPINAVIGLINRMIGSLNRVKVSVPGWVPIVGGKTFGVNIPTIPMLATGGVVMPRHGGVPAILAEAGEAEAVLPLSKLDRLLAVTARRARMAQSLQSGGGAGTGLHIEHYHAARNSDPQSTADALMYLAKARG